MRAVRAAVTDRPSRPQINLDPDRWRAPSDGPRWLYAEPGRLRAVWRLAVFGLALTLFQPIAESIITPIIGAIGRTLDNRQPAYPWVTLAATLAAVTLALRTVDQRPWRAVALGDGAWRVRTLLSGGALGAVAISTTFALLWATGSVSLASVPTSIDGAPLVGSWSSTAVRLAVLLAPAALWEELMFRGYLWTVAEDAAGVRVARWTTAIAFGVVHLMNPGASAQSTLLVITAGLGLGAIREHTGSLATAWLAHTAWNWVMAAVMHLPVSGIAFETPGYRAIVSGPSWWTGGAWGPEGGIAALLVVGGAIALHARFASATHMDHQPSHQLRTETSSRD